MNFHEAAVISDNNNYHSIYRISNDDLNLSFYILCLHLRYVRYFDFSPPFINVIAPS